MTQDVIFSIVGAVVLALGLVLTFRLIRGDSRIRISRFGVFVERERFPETDEPDEQPTREWPAP